MTAWALPVTFTGGACVLCAHPDGEPVAHEWKRVGAAAASFAAIVCWTTLRVYVHEFERAAFERWAARHPDAAVPIEVPTGHLL